MTARRQAGFPQETVREEREEQNDGETQLEWDNVESKRERNGIVILYKQCNPYDRRQTSTCNQTDGSLAYTPFVRTSNDMAQSFSSHEKFFVISQTWSTCSFNFSYIDLLLDQAMMYEMEQNELYLMTCWEFFVLDGHG